MLGLGLDKAVLQSMRHDKKEGSAEKEVTTCAKPSAATKALAEQAEAAKSINQLSKQELEDLLKKVRTHSGRRLAGRAYAHFERRYAAV